jgi:hypothetical protein
MQNPSHLEKAPFVRAVTMKLLKIIEDRQRKINHLLAVRRVTVISPGNFLYPSYDVYRGLHLSYS